jgi:hypothetical protein
MDVKKFAGYSKGAYLSNADIKIATITSNPNIIALLELYAGPAMCPYPVKIFDTLDSARTWLG